jgi:hypothetical protein
MTQHNTDDMPLWLCLAFALPIYVVAMIAQKLAVMTGSQFAIIALCTFGALALLFVTNNLIGG